MFFPRRLFLTPFTEVFAQMSPSQWGWPTWINLLSRQHVPCHLLSFYTFPITLPIPTCYVIYWLALLFIESFPSPVHACLVASVHVRLFVTLWTLTHQVPLSMGFSRQEYWSGLPCPPPGDLPDPRTEPTSPALQADSLLLNHPGSLQYVLVNINSRKRCLNKIIVQKKFNTSWNISITYKILHYLKYIH